MRKVLIFLVTMMEVLFSSPEESGFLKGGTITVIDIIPKWVR